MKKNKVKIAGFLLVSAFFIMLPAVSLLGENDRATTVVQGYFDDIALKDFYKTTELCTEEFLQQFSDLSDMINQQFCFCLPRSKILT